MEYTPRKYGRTLHLPQSLAVTNDDKVHTSISQFEGHEVVISEKLDGENTTIFCEGTHARSIDGRFHPSRSWMKQFAAGISPFLDVSERIVGEYLFARHSIAYDNLETYFYGFAWFIEDELQAWNDTQERFSELGIISVPVLYHGPYFDGLIEKTANELNLETQEGFVLRSASSIVHDDFSKYVGKFVRQGHVQTDKHWMHSEIVPNLLKEK